MVGSLRLFLLVEPAGCLRDALSVGTGGSFDIGIEDFFWGRCKRPNFREGFGIGAAFDTSNF
ncbi:hypothetical protein D3C86_2021320 [compost metagenome]